jgi:hypothetical protein
VTLQWRNGVAGDLPVNRGRKAEGMALRPLLRVGARLRRAGAVAGVVAALALGACAHGMQASDGPSADDADINMPPTNYKAEILGAMHAYFNDPTGLRDAGLSEPALKPVGNNRRYVVCVRFTGKKIPGGRERERDRARESNPDGAAPPEKGPKELAAIFVAGRFDRFQEKAQEPCAGVAYAPFPELEKLAR